MKKGKLMAKPPTLIPVENARARSGAPVNDPMLVKIDIRVYNRAVWFRGTKEVRKDLIAGTKPDPRVYMAIAAGALVMHGLLRGELSLESAYR